MAIDNYVNDLCKIMNQIGIEYDTLIDKKTYQDARNQIKHFIQNGGDLVKKENNKHFEDYCRQVFESYLPKL